MITPSSEQVLALGGRYIDFAGVECLPSDIRALIADPDTFCDSRVLDYTTSHSTIARVLHANPASDAMLRIVYPDANGHPLTQGLDKFLSRGLSGQALRDRLAFCSQWLADHFVKPDASVIDLGGGSGAYALKALRIAKKKRRPIDGCTWTLLDIDREALDVAHKWIDRAKLHDHIKCVHGNFMQNVWFKADYAVLIGVLCGMDFDTAVKVLRRAKDHLQPGGEIFAATLLQRAFNEDPWTFRILCNVGGWQLRPKTLDQVLSVFQAAGWTIIGTFSERPPHNAGCGQYAIVHARA